MAVPIQFTNRNGAGSEAVMKLTHEKFERLYKYAANITKIHVTFNTEHQKHIAEAELHIPKMPPVFADAESEDMYKSLDLLVDRLVKQIAKHKEKVTDHG
jgi:putative sigma-54 modulation protein